MCPGTHSEAVLAASSRAHMMISPGEGGLAPSGSQNGPSAAASLVKLQPASGGRELALRPLWGCITIDGAEVQRSAQLVPRLPARWPAGLGTLRPPSRAVTGLVDGTAAQGPPATALMGALTRAGRCWVGHSPSGLCPHLEPRCRSRVCLGPSPGHPGHTPGDTLLRGAVGHVDDPPHEDGDVSQATGATGLCHSDSCSAGDHSHQTLLHSLLSQNPNPIPRLFLKNWKRNQGAISYTTDGLLFPDSWVEET